MDAKFLERLKKRNVDVREKDGLLVITGAHLPAKSFFDMCDILGPGRTVMDTALQNLVFMDCVLDKANLSGLHLDNVTFHGCRMPDARFVGTRINNVRFKNVVLTNTVFENSEGKNCLFSRSDMTQACVRKSYWYNVDFLHTRLLRANLVNVDMNQVSMNSCDCRGMSGQNVTVNKLDVCKNIWSGVRWIGSSFSGLFVQEGRISGDFENCHIYNGAWDGVLVSKFRKCEIVNNVFHQCNMDNAVWECCDIKSSKFFDASLMAAGMTACNIVDSEFLQVNMTGAHVRKTDFAHCFLKDIDLSNAVWNGEMSSCVCRNWQRHGADLGGLIIRETPSLPQTAI